MKTGEQNLIPKKNRYGKWIVQEERSIWGFKYMKTLTEYDHDDALVLRNTMNFIGSVESIQDMVVDANEFIKGDVVHNPNRGKV